MSDHSSTDTTYLILSWHFISHELTFSSKVFLFFHSKLYNSRNSRSPRRITRRILDIRRRIQLSKVGLCYPAETARSRMCQADIRVTRHARSGGRLVTCMHRPLSTHVRITFVVFELRSQFVFVVLIVSVEF